MLDTMNGAVVAAWTQGQPVLVCYSWTRNAAYGGGTPIVYTTLAT